MEQSNDIAMIIKCLWGTNHHSNIICKITHWRLTVTVLWSRNCYYPQKIQTQRITQSVIEYDSATFQFQQLVSRVHMHDLHALLGWKSRDVRSFLILSQPTAWHWTSWLNTLDFYLYHNRYMRSLRSVLWRSCSSLQTKLICHHNRRIDIMFYFSERHTHACTDTDVVPISDEFIGLCVRILYGWNKKAQTSILPRLSSFIFELKLLIFNLIFIEK